MSVLKDFVFNVGVDRLARKKVRVAAPGRPNLEIATPPEFSGAFPAVWSPEDMLVGAVASCYALTLAAVAQRRDVPIYEVSVAGAGHVTARADGRFGFVVVELRVTLTTDEGREEEARMAAHAAEEGCLVGQALEIPVEVELDLRSVSVPALVAS